jgi:hypothetical protein
MSTSPPRRPDEADDDAIYYRPFADILKEIGKGGLHADLSKALAEVTAAVVEHAQPGSITLTIKVAPIKDANAEALTVSGTCVVKKPTLPATSLMYGDLEGLLTRNDPRQLVLPYENQETPSR